MLTARSDETRRYIPLSQRDLPENEAAWVEIRPLSFRAKGLVKDQFRAVAGGKDGEVPTEMRGLGTSSNLAVSYGVINFGGIHDAKGRPVECKRKASRAGGMLMDGSLEALDKAEDGLLDELAEEIMEISGLGAGPSGNSSTLSTSPADGPNETPMAPTESGAPVPPAEDDQPRPAE